MSGIETIKNLFENSCEHEIIRSEFSAEATQQAKMAVKMRISPHIQSRLDLRGKTIFTFGNLPISNNSVDYTTVGHYETEKTDCAFSLEKKRGVFQLGMHIADVDEYVNEGSPLDIEAKRRGVTINTPKQSFPLLHDSISRGVCAFIEGEDRLAVSIFLDIDSNGRLLGLRFEKSVVRIARNCIFSEIDTLYTSSDSSAVLPLREKYATLLPNLNEMYELGGILYAARMAAGNTAFTQLKRRYSFNENGQVASVELKPDYDSLLLVCEYFVFTGTSLAQYMNINAIPCIYANQPLINKEHLAEMANIANVSIVDDCVFDEKLLNTILNKVKHTPKDISIAILASKFLPSTRYELLPRIYWFYGAPLVRFSSPVTRYSDIAVQRVIKSLIKAKGETNSLNIAKIKKNMVEAAHIVNITESEAKELQSKVSDLCSLQIMKNKPNDSYPAFITSFDSKKINIFFENGLTGSILPQTEIIKINTQDFIADKKQYSLGQRIEAISLDLSGGIGNSIFRI